MMPFMGLGLGADGAAAIATAARRQPVASIAALKALTPSADDAVTVLGYYAAADGGGGVFYYDGASSATDNGGTIIAPDAGSGRWMRAYSGAVNVKWFGAKGDGVTDDTAPLQSALNLGRSVFMPKGRYVIKAPLDITNRSAIPITVSGEGWAEAGGGSAVYAETGGVALDCTGSQFISLRDLSIVSQGRPNASTVGILFARATAPASAYSQFITIQNVLVDIKSDITAHGGRGSVGIYNLAAEIHEYQNLYALADTPLVFSSSNVWNISSPYQTINTSITSTSQLTLSGAGTLTSKNPAGQCLYLYGAFGVELSNIYLRGAGTDVASYAIYMEGMRRLRASCHIEDADRIAYINYADDIKIDVTMPDPRPYAPIYLGNAFNTLNKIDLNIELGSGSASAWPYVIEGLSTSAINGLSVCIGGDDGNVELTNVVNVQGSFRKVRSATLTKGGYKDLHLVGTTVCEAWVTFDPQVAANVPVNALFRDTSDGKLKYKDNLGVVNAMY